MFWENIHIRNMHLLYKSCLPDSLGVNQFFSRFLKLIKEAVNFRKIRTWSFDKYITKIWIRKCSLSARQIFLSIYGTVCLACKIVFLWNRELFLLYGITKELNACGKFNEGIWVTNKIMWKDLTGKVGSLLSFNKLGHNVDLMVNKYNHIMLLHTSIIPLKDQPNDLYLIIIKTIIGVLCFPILKIKLVSLISAKL